ncbi:Transposon Tf2-6 polyprotein [Labeo rohita]|uniref:Gypsy retrotransposon integrase-like protein 1 n=1 Tax=Labeo rohita TaxID=84645 RepID=A0ABQ8MV46_LABRO|nr:Transposon Tf2-6 polyprotein [Labeo rohita]
MAAPGSKQGSYKTRANIANLAEDVTLCGFLHPPPAGAFTGVLVTTFPTIPCLGLHFRFRVTPVHFPFGGHSRAPLCSAPREDWATAVWDLGQPIFPSFAAFLQSFKEAFQPSPESREAGDQIMALKQGRRTAADYALDFRTLAAQSGWNDGPLKLHYRKGLNPDLQNHVTRKIVRFFIISSPQTPLILGYPWLNLHESIISWSAGAITHWSSHCKQHCPQPANPATSTPVSAGPRDSIPAEYQDLLEAFSTTKATQLPPHRPGDCAVDLLPGAVPPRGRIFPLSQPESEAMNQYIREELAKGFIRPSTSPASAGLFFVKKKDGGLRPSLEQLRMANIYTKLDLRSAYNLIRIREGDEWKTAFSMTTGHYEYRVMPFGLANSPSYFQAFVNEVFRDMLNRWVIIYIDDILIYSNSVTEHVQHVRAVLQRLIEHQLYAKLEKCEFHQERITFLGYVISPEGVAMDDSKVNAVRSWPRPKTLKELQLFLGFSKFYRRFIRNFSTMAAPLTSMIKQGNTRLTWSPSAAQAYDELRQRFTTAPILHHPDPNLPFLVEVDASSTGVGAVLSQRQGQPPKTFPCAFFSHKLSPAEQNYDVGNRELLAIKLALEEWWHWLEGAKHPFTILTDHRNLEYLRSARVLNHRQARWSLFFTRFQFEITYRPGSQNTKADALSRMHKPDRSTTPPETILPASVILTPVAWDIMTEITEGHAQDPLPTECPENLTYVPTHLRSRVLSEVHSTPSSGHPGIEATIKLLNNRFWWQSLRSDTITFIKNCSVCNTSKTPRQLPAGLLQPLPGCCFIPFPKLPTAMETAEALCNSVFCFYGLLENIVSDRGPQFTSRLWSNFFHLLGVNVSLTSGYHPQANGQAERLNQELTKFLCSYCQDHQEDWSRFLLWAEYAQNSIRKPSTNLTPFQCVLGYQPPLVSLVRGSLRICLQSTPGSNGARRPGTGPMSTCNGPSVGLGPRPIEDVGPGHPTNLSSGCGFLLGTCAYIYRARNLAPVSFRLELPPEYRISPTFHVSLLKPAGCPGGAENLEPCSAGTYPPDHRWRGGLPSKHHSGLPALEGSSTVPGRLGGLRPRGEVMGACRGHPRSCSHYRLSYIAPRSTRTSWKGKTTAPVTSSCQEALAGGALSQGRSLWLPPSSASGSLQLLFYASCTVARTASPTIHHADCAIHLWPISNPIKAPDSHSASNEYCGVLCGD